MVISVRGIGWLNQEEYGCLRTRKRHSCTDGEPGKELFSYPVKYFGRFDRTSRMTCYAVALALQDAGIGYGHHQKQDIGIIGTSATGSLGSDRRYFKDYIDSGRTLSRGNLFIYTLPSSPLGEAAIHFGLQGPLLYTATHAAPLSAAIGMAVESICADESAIMLAGKIEEHEAVFFVVAKNDDRQYDTLCDVTEATALVNASRTLEEMITELTNVDRGRA